MAGGAMIALIVATLINHSQLSGDNGPTLSLWQDGGFNPNIGPERNSVKRVRRSVWQTLGWGHERLLTDSDCDGSIRIFTDVIMTLFGTRVCLIRVTQPLIGGHCQTLSSDWSHNFEGFPRLIFGATVTSSKTFLIKSLYAFDDFCSRICVFRDNKKDELMSLLRLYSLIN